MMNYWVRINDRWFIFFNLWFGISFSKIKMQSKGQVPISIIGLSSYASVNIIYKEIIVYVLPNSLTPILSVTKYSNPPAACIL